MKFLLYSQNFNFMHELHLDFFLEKLFCTMKQKSFVKFVKCGPRLSVLPFSTCFVELKLRWSNRMSVPNKTLRLTRVLLWNLSCRVIFQCKKRWRFPSCPPAGLSYREMLNLAPACLTPLISAALRSASGLWKKSLALPSTCNVRKICRRTYRHVDKQTGVCVTMVTTVAVGYLLFAPAGKARLLPVFLKGDGGGLQVNAWRWVCPVAHVCDTMPLNPWNIIFYKQDHKWSSTRASELPLWCRAAFIH